MNCELSPSEDYLRNKLLRSASEEGLNIPSTPEFSCDGNLILIWSCWLIKILFLILIRILFLTLILFCSWSSSCSWAWSRSCLWSWLRSYSWSWLRSWSCNLVSGSDPILFSFWSWSFCRQPLLLPLPGARPRWQSSSLSRLPSQWNIIVPGITIMTMMFMMIIIVKMMTIPVMMVVGITLMISNRWHSA